MARRYDRGRMISRSMYTSGDLVDLPAWQRLLWSGLIVFADNSGMVRDNDVLFRGTLLAGLRHSRDAVRRAIDTFAARSMLSRCKLDGVSYLKITNFDEGQRLKDRKGAQEREREREREDERERENSLRGEEERREEAPPRRPPPPSSGSRSLPPAPSSAFQEAAEFLNLELCANPHDAVEALKRMALDEQGLREYVRSFREALKAVAAKGGLKDPRAYVRSRALRFPTAAAASITATPKGDRVSSFAHEQDEQWAERERRDRGSA